MTRRELLKLLSATPILLLNPPMIFGSEAAPHKQNKATAGRWNRTVVLIELHGGNDGLNTVIPYTNSTYYDLRPRLAIPRDQIFQLSQTLGLHPALEPFMSMWDAKELAIVNGVGYPNPNRSHFRSIEIWETGSNSHEFLDAGWLTRVFEQHPPPSAFTAEAILLGRGDAGPVSGGNTRAIALQNPQYFLKQSQQVRPVTTTTANQALAHVLKIQRDISRTADDLYVRLQKVPGVPNTHPNSKIGKQLQIAAQLLTARVPAPVIKITHGSFDTHAGQLNQHQRLLKELAEGLAAFRTTMIQQGLWDEIVVMTYSEFGRRVAENGSQGTDHGTAAPHFLLGGQVKGGLYGQMPSLTDLQNGDLRFSVDYRSLYTSLVQSWWGLPSDTLDGRKYPVIDCLS